jgi:2,5-dihydroxypyridine 5,6-dioxygenase
MLLPQKTDGLKPAKSPGTDYIYDTLKETARARGLALTLPGGFIIYGTDEGYELFKQGIRNLHNSIDEQALRRLWPTEDVIRRCFTGVKFMEKAKTVKVTSKSGTDLLYDKTGRNGHCVCSLAHEPGRYDNSGYGKVCCGPPFVSVEGTLVLDSGSYIHPLDRLINTPIKFTIKDGYIKKIDGDFDAKLLEMWFESWKDPEVYRCSHMGWGTNDGAKWVGHGVTSNDRYNYYGSVVIAFGSNTLRAAAKYSGYDEKIVAAAHCDIDILNQSLWLDEAQILEKGKIVHPECK